MSFRFDYKTGQWVQTTPTTVPSTTTPPTTTPPTTTPPTTTPPTTVPPVVVKKTTNSTPQPFDLDKEIAKIDDAAKAYLESTGEQPSTAWYTAKMLPIQTYLNDKDAERQAAADRAKTIADRQYQTRLIAEENAREDKYRQAQLDLQRAAAGSAAAARAQERRDALDKEKRDRKFQLAQENRQNQFAIDAENRAAARQDALEAVARIRGIEGGEAAAQVLESDAGRRTLEGLQRIKDLYDPMDKMANEEFATQLDLLSKDFETARGQVKGAGEDFLKSFVDSVAYQNVPISTLEAPTNPLLAALQSQGAGTGEVQAVSDFAKQFATSTSDLGKWAASQLNVGQQNFDIASKRASTGATTAALQGLAGQEPRIKAGMQSDLNKRLQDIALQRAQSEESVYARQQDAESRAAALRAETLMKYGKPDKPKETETQDEAAKAAEAAKKKAEEEARKAGIAQAKAARKPEFGEQVPL